MVKMDAVKTEMALEFSQDNLTIRSQFQMVDLVDKAVKLFDFYHTAVSRKVVQQNRTRQCQKELWVMEVPGP